MKIPRSYSLYCLAILLCANSSHALTPEHTSSINNGTGQAAPSLSNGENFSYQNISTAASELERSYPVFPRRPPTLSQAYTLFGSTAHQQINTIWPHSVGIMGAGVTVAVVDSGIFQHEAFGSRLRPGLDVVTDGLDPNNNGLVDPQGHGTFVAGILAAGLNGLTVGVAPEATVVPIRVLDVNNSGSSDTIYNAISSSGSLNARIYNMSLASTGGDSNFRTTIAWLANNGKIGVIAAGNEGLANPAYPARYATESYAQGSIIVVGSVDANNQLSSFSNAAGDTASYYLVAPGENIIAPSNQPGWYVQGSGTSMATPMVSGAAALVWGNWPYLSPQVVVQILLQSATPLGPASLYGHGLLNLEAAFEPIGDFTMPLANNGSSSLNYGENTVSIPSAARVTSTSTGQVVFFDSFRRGFYVPSRSLISQSVAPSFSAQQLQSPIGSSRVQNQQINNFTLHYQSNSSTGYGDVRLDYQMNDNASLAFFSGPLLAPFNLAEALNGETLSFHPHAYTNPYLQQITRPTGFALNYEISEHTRIMFGSAMSDSGQAAAWIQAQTQYGGLTTQVQVGNLVSNQTAPHTAQNLTIGASSQAQFAGISMLYRAAPHWFGIASYMVGNQESQQTQYNSSLQLTSRTASFGLFREVVMSEQDRLGISLILPPRIANGKATTDAVVDYDHTTGAPIYGQVSYGLDSVQERDLELSYLYPNKKRVYGLSVGQRFNPNGQTDVPPETVLSARYITYF